MGQSGCDRALTAGRGPSPDTASLRPAVHRQGIWDGGLESARAPRPRHAGHLPHPLGVSAHPPARPAGSRRGLRCLLLARLFGSFVGRRGPGRLGRFFIISCSSATRTRTDGNGDRARAGHGGRAAGVSWQSRDRSGQSRCCVLMKISAARCLRVLEGRVPLRLAPAWPRAGRLEVKRNSANQSCCLSCPGARRPSVPGLGAGGRDGRPRPPPRGSWQRGQPRVRTRPRQGGHAAEGPARPRPPGGSSGGGADSRVHSR